MNRKQSHKRSCRHGSLALEAALLLPVILVLLLSLLMAIDAIRQEIMIRNAMDQVASELALVSPALDQWPDLVDLLTSMRASRTVLLQAQAPELPAAKTVSGASLPPDGNVIAATDDSVDKTDWLAFWKEILPPEVSRSTEKIREWLSSAALDLSSSILLQDLLQYRLDYWLAEQRSSQAFATARPTARQLYLEWQTDDHQLWLMCSYQLPLGLFTVAREAATVVPLWSGWRPEIADKNKSDSVWMMDNFSRGKVLRQKFGANLPDDFPVIARLANGEALMIHSIDLTAPTYSSSSTAARQTLLAALKRLAQFDGATYSRKGQTIQVTPADIRSRRLLLVIPANYNKAIYDSVIQLLKGTARQLGLAFEVVTYGTSERYITATGG